MNNMTAAFAKVKKFRTVVCNYCNEPCEFVLGDKIYPHRPDLFTKGFYQCAPCDSYVGCHPHTSTPMGRVANAKLRRLKSTTHQAFDQIWKSGQVTRASAYAWLATELKMTKEQCHIGMFDEEQCIQAITMCTDKTDTLYTMQLLKC